MMGVKEFQAVIMAAGKGSRMMELTAGLPKCLLPVANKPLIFYPLNMFQNADFRDVIVIILEIHKLDIQAAIENLGLKIRVELVGIPHTEEWGTADSLRFISDRIKHDVLVASCDLITDVNLSDILDVYRRHKASLTALFFPTPASEGPVVLPGPKTKHKPEQDIVAIDTGTSRLAFLASASDFEEVVYFCRSMLRKHPRLVIHSALVDAHLYVIKKWVCNFLISDRSCSTLKGELLPYIVKKQYSRPSTKCDTGASVVDVSTSKDMFQFAVESPLSLKVREMSSYNDHAGDMQPTYHGDSIRCYAYVAKPDTFGLRANTLPSYWYVTNKILERWRTVTGEIYLSRISQLSDVQCTQMDDKCLVNERTTVSAKTSIKNSHIGSGCDIQPKVRLTNCLIMDGVHLGEGAVLSNCIVCSNTQIGPGSQLKDCIVGYNHSIAAGEKHATEMLTDTDRLMEI